jgi:hypothetical protein
MQRPCHCLNFKLKWRHWNFVHGRRTTGKSRQPQRFRANGSPECAPDDRLHPSRTCSGSRWRSRQENASNPARIYSNASATLKHTINAAVLSDTTARARSACFSISASMFIYAERPVSFQRRRERKHRPTPGLVLLLLVLGLPHLRVPAAQTFEGLFRSGFRSRNHVHPALRARWSPQLFWHARGITDAHRLRYP